MEEVVLIDSGPLVALLDRSEQHHEWAVAQWRKMQTPVVTCQAVITEAAFLLARNRCSPVKLLTMIERGAVAPDFAIAGEAAAIRDLMAKYSDLPMSFADACLVRLSEIHDRCRVFTLDGQFRLYRRHRRRSIPLRFPPR
jgi:predicted nucleic acid-binding protein